MSNGQISELYDKLYPYTQVSNAVKELHIQNIEKKQEQPAVTEQEKRCPRCNSALVLRTASKGENKGNQFYGCSNYPKCRFMEKLDQDEIKV